MTFYFYGMKWLLFLLALYANIGFSQSLKKRQLGIYTGTIGSYRMGIDNNVFTVDPAEVVVEITADSLFQTIGDVKTAGTYFVRETTKTYTVIEFKPVNQVILVEYRIYRKGKKLTRKGIYPQPDAELRL